MESHRHPEYEQTFNRIATVLDVIVESQSKHVQEMAEIREAQSKHEQEMAEIREVHARLEQTVEKLGQTVDRASILIERLAIKSAENEDKLNALINLMDQHINEHRRDG
jgi:chromosome segregation ATPase